MTETECVYCAVRTGSLYIIQANFRVFISNIPYDGIVNLVSIFFVFFISKLTLQWLFDARQSGCGGIPYTIQIPRKLSRSFVVHDRDE
jgi:hypothetical protein